MATEENRERNEEFERRVLAIIRNQFEYMARSSPNGYEFAEFVITATYWSAPQPNAEMKPWYGGPYPGWLPYQWTTGSSISLEMDKVVLDAAVAHVQSLLDETPEFLDEDGPDDESSDADDED